MCNSPVFAYIQMKKGVPKCPQAFQNPKYKPDLVCLTGMRHGRALGEHGLECQRGSHAGHHDQQDHSGKVDRVYHTDGQTLLRHDQCHLAAGHHTDADLQGIVPVEAADLCCQTAADDLGNQCHNHEADAEE